MIISNKDHKLINWSKLAICAVTVYILMLYIAPRLESTLHLEKIGAYIDEHEIEANMYFYTEVEAFSEAQINMDHSMRYSPIQNQMESLGFVPE